MKFLIFVVILVGVIAFLIGWGLGWIQKIPLEYLIGAALAGLFGLWAFGKVTGEI